MRSSFFNYIKRNKILLGFCFTMLTCQISFSQTIWQGQHHSTRIILSGDLAKYKTDSLMVSIPEFEMKNIKVGTKVEADSVSFKSEMYGFSFKGKYNSDKTAISGIFNYYSIANASIVLKKEKEILNIGLFDTAKDFINIIEWPEIAMNSFNDFLQIKFTYDPDKDLRFLEFNGKGKWLGFSIND